MVLLCVATNYVTLSSPGLTDSDSCALESTPQTHFATLSQDMGIHSKSELVLIYDGCFTAFTVTQNLPLILHIQHCTPNTACSELYSESESQCL